MTDIVIASAARTPVGSFNGAFANLPAHDLGAVAIKAALERAKLAGKEVDEVFLQERHETFRERLFEGSVFGLEPLPDCEQPRPPD